ncbi:MAG: ABC transporter substrate-binding protein [Chitinivibrionales bacterium]|nr:ABC transporter substrate-binding protein [Chitinivibrionales bacterium]
MIHGNTLAALFSFFSVLFISNAEELPQLKVLVENDPYQVNEKGQPYGASIDILKELFKRSNIPENFTVIPWARGYLQAQEEPNIILVLAARTIERENLFKWIGPIDRDQIGLYVKSGSTLKFNSLEDARMLKTIGVVRGSSEEQMLESKGFKNLDKVNNPVSNISKLIAGRTEIILVGPSNLKSVTEAAGCKESDVELKLIVQDIKYYYIASMDTPDKAVRLLNSKLDEMKKDGTFDRLFVKNNQKVPAF